MTYIYAFRHCCKKTYVLVNKQALLVLMFIAFAYVHRVSLLYLCSAGLAQLHSGSQASPLRGPAGHQLVPLPSPFCQSKATYQHVTCMYEYAAMLSFS